MNTKRSRLSEVKSGRIERPPRLLVYGVEGIGKSTFASGAPNPIFLGPENGTDALDVKRYPATQTWQDLLDAVDDLTLNEHEYQTLAIDTLDWIEPLIHDHICAQHNPPLASIEDIGFGKGYVAALSLGRLLLSRLDKLRDARNMTIIVLGHCMIRQFKNPEGDDYDRYEIKVNTKFASLVREWSDACLFANYEVSTYEKNNKSKGISTGRRLLYTNKRAAFDAKNRMGLPDTIKLDWQEFDTARKASTSLLSDVESLMKRLSDVDVEMHESARSWLTAKPRASHQIAELKKKIESRLSEK